jgi:hypothetical protein
MALTDEIADVVMLMENGGTSSCSAAPRPSCRLPIEAEASHLLLKDDSADERDGLVWAFRKGELTDKTDYGSPVTTDSYALCLYEDDALVQGFEIPAAQLCNGKPCWRELARGFVYRDRDLTPDGIGSVRMTQGLADGKTAIRLRGKGQRLGLPDLTQLGGVLEVQLQRIGDSACWAATYTPPFVENDGETLRARSDAPPDGSIPDPVWSEIHALVIGPTCGSCHGGSGGLSGLDDCNNGYANLVGVASTRLPAMSRVEAGDPTMSFFMHKLDGTQGMFDAMCNGGACGLQMPLGGDPLPVGVRDAIRTWILDGALNDCP